MKVTLKTGKVIDAVSIDETWTPNNSHGTVLGIFMVSDLSVDQLREIFTPDACETLTVENDEGAVSTITGYKNMDSIRKDYGGKANFDTSVNLVK